MKATLFCKCNAPLSLVSPNLSAPLMLIMHSVPGIREMVLKRLNLQKRPLPILSPDFLSKYPSC